MSIVGATSTEGLSSLQRFTNIFTAILTSFRHKRAALANSSPLGREDQHQILAFGFLRAIVLKVLKREGEFKKKAAAEKARLYLPDGSGGRLRWAGFESRSKSSELAVSTALWDKEFYRRGRWW
jgi:hypothetical protein